MNLSEFSIVLWVALKILPGAFAADGRVNILDFGLARIFPGETVDEADVENSPTITGVNGPSIQSSPGQDAVFRPASLD